MDPFPGTLPDCPKCGDDESSCKWGRYTGLTDADLEECLNWACKRCEYTWQTECADAVLELPKIVWKP